jgi:uncharacterized membrane protein YphA (DoxX/SURF4 family)
MSSPGVHPQVRIGRPATALVRARQDPALAAFWMLRIGFVVLPFWMGLDKFLGVLTPDWPHYLAPWIVGLAPFSAQTAMHIVGIIEMAAGVMIAIKPRYAAYVVALWLAGIIINFLTYPGFYDIALRDFGLLIAALALAALSAVYDSRSPSHEQDRRAAR